MESLEYLCLSTTLVLVSAGMVLFSPVTSSWFVLGFTTSLFLTDLVNFYYDKKTENIDKN